MRTSTNQVKMDRKLIMAIATVFLMLYSGEVCAQNFLIDHTTSSTLNYELRPATGNSFYVYSGGSTTGPYSSLGPIKVTGGGTLNITFNTSAPVILYKAASESGTPAYNTYSVLVTYGTLNMSLGSSYSASTTLKRATDLLLQVFRVQSSTTDNQNSCRLNISGNANHRFVIDGMSNMTVEGANDTNYVATNSGLEATGCLLTLSGNGGRATLEYVNLVNNWVTSGGSAIALGLSNATAHFHLTMRHCLIDKCYTGSSGAGWNFSGVYNGTTSSDITMEDCIVQNCFTESSGSSDGGTFRTWSGPNCNIVMTDCQILNNKSKKRSGGIMYNLAMSQPMKLTRCTFDGNWTGENGGALQLQAAADVTACTFTNNFAKINGGAICNRPYDGGSGNSSGYAPHNGSLILDANTIIRNNEAKGNGGGIYVFVHPTMFLMGSSTTYPPYGINPAATWTVFKNNNGQQFAMNVELQGATISNNKAVNGGGIFLHRDCDIYQTNVLLNWGTVENNIATGNGGACYVFSEIPTLNYANKDEQGNPCPYTGDARNMVVALGNSSSPNTLSMKGNVAANGGGVYSTFDHNASVTSSTIKASLQQNAVVGTSDSPNLATAGNGGALYIDKGYITLLGGSIQYNTATSAGGGIYPSTNAIVQVGAGNFSVEHNTVNGVPNNVYLPTNKKIEVISNAFNPRYIGVYTQSTSTPIPVFNVSNSANYTWLQRIYDGMVAGTMNVVDDKQLYTADYTSPQTILYFSNNPWSPMQRTITLSDLHQDANNVYEIGNVKELTAFLCHVNGITPNAVNFGSGDQAAKGKLTADIDMDGHYWVPIGTGYTGTFDGNGYIISNLTMVPTNASLERGMFGVNTSGTIKNVNLRDAYFAGAGSYIGSIVSQMNGGTLYNSVAQCELLATANTCKAGGLVGHINGGTVHSSIATCEMTGYTMGGLAGKITSGNLYNSFANPLFHYRGGSYFVGGLVAENSGTVANCYVRFSRTQTLTGAKFGMLAGSNSGSISYCYGPDGSSAQFNHSYTYLYNNATTGLSNHDLYKKVDAPYLYNRPNDNLVGSTGKTLTEKLNNWVGTSDVYALWKRTTAGGYTYTYNYNTYTGGNINDDYPMPKMKGLSNVASTDGFLFDYAASLSRAITKYNGLTGGGTLWLYASPKNASGNDEVVNVDNDSDVLLYIDEDAALLQAANNSLTAYTSQTLSIAASSRWHFISSSLTNRGIGFNYGTTSQVGFSWSENPCNVTFSRNEDGALFPSDVPNINKVDLYAFYEPEYHWLNLKRNSASHWHMNATTLPIVYNGNGTGGNGNETSLVPGKGYLVSIDKEQLLQNKGVLNNGSGTLTLQDVTYNEANAWAGLLGYNLLGNPYQSYLDFTAFITDASNSGLNASKAHVDPTYAIYDPEVGAYVQYKAGSSKGSRSADGMIHPHQGFMIRRTSGSYNATATFKNSMRSTNSTSPFRGEQPAFPVINLTITDDEGNADIAVLELGRGNDEGAEKLRANTSKGWIYLHYLDNDYAILFRTEVENYQPLWFEASEEGTYMLAWEMANAEFEDLTLIDNITGVTTNMLACDSYTFEATPDQYASRFKIVIGEYKDIEENEGGTSTGSATATFAFVMGDDIVVNGEGRLEIMDVTGRVILCRNASHASAISKAGMTPGVYILRLTDGKKTKVQKMIIE